MTLRYAGAILRAMTEAARSLSLDEYLALDVGETKHEFVGGAVHAMAGGTPERAAIAANVIGHLRMLLRDRPCQVYTSDVRVAVEATDLRTYPDVTIVCGEVRRLDKGISLVNPVVLFEITSDSSTDWDRGGKFAHYRRIPSLREYVVVNHGERLVEHHTRGEPSSSGDIWTLRDVRDAGTVELVSLGCALPLDEIYLKVEVPPSPR